MNKEEINYSGILWPNPYRADALGRAEELRSSDQTLAELYKTVFNPELLRLDPIPLPIPFSKSLKPEQRLKYIKPQESELPLSIVTITRNDNHVERMEERTQAFIDSVYYLAEKHQRKVEVIIVEWNPPPEKPTLEKAFNFPAKHDFVSTIIVQVPAELHNSYERVNNLPLYQMIAKNVGIRRARGEFILSTNIDVLLSDELFELITSPALKPGKIYRSNRWDVDRAILDKGSSQNMIECARELCFQINYAHITLPKDAPVPEANPMVDYAGFRLLPDVHTMACGDFQLLHRDDWAKVAGFSELDTFSLHLDSLFAITCHHAGIEEVRLDNLYAHYHIDHTLGTSVKQDTYVVEDKKAMKHLSMFGLINISRNMEEQKDHYVFNKDNWGIAGRILPTTQVTNAAWERLNYSSNTTIGDSSKGSLECFQLATVNIDEQTSKQQKELLEQIVKNTANHLKRLAGKKIHIWGAGHKAYAFKTLLASHDIKIHSFIHNGNTQPLKIEDEHIIHASELSRDQQDFYLICSMHADEIIHQLNKQKLIEGQHYMVAF